METPRTDKEAEKTNGDYYLDGYVTTEFAQELEAELSTLRAENEAKTKALERLYWSIMEETDKGVKAKHSPGVCIALIQAKEFVAPRGQEGEG